ncbi:hypothetical protein LQZ19_15885 [Treponema primitia]|uniref:hypothetical protein n=1 Tax=Treponema primitia TaxID=88058 RepID=UPI003980DB40
MDDFDKTNPYRFYFRATFISRVLRRIFGLSNPFWSRYIRTGYVSYSPRFRDLNTGMDIMNITNRFIKLEAIICFCENNVLYSLWGDKHSGYKIEYPNLHKYLQHCSIHLDPFYDKQYYYDFFRPVKRIFNKITHHELKVEHVEVITVCSETDDLGIIIRIHSDDHGYMNNELLDENQSPAHAHVFNLGGEEIGILNITGPAPIKSKDVKIKHRVRNRESWSQEVKADIAKWARRPSKLPSCKNMTGWEAARFIWGMYHLNNRYTGLVNSD